MLAEINDRLDRLVRGRPFIVAMDVADVATGIVDYFRRAGAADVLVVAATTGSGELPDAQTVLFPPMAPAPTVMAGIRRVLELIEQPPASIQAAVDAFDPAGRAMVIVPSFATSPQALGRRVWGARRVEWVALEDKMQADGLWDAAGVARALSLRVPVAEAPEASGRLDSGDGTVWAADNRRRWHGGGDYTRWLRPGADLGEAVAWFSPRAHAVRVMPFLEGIPSSIHGFVTPDGVAAFRPVEMVILRRVDSSQFVYGSVASFWDPPVQVRAEMREAARRVGWVLRARVGYRGPFSIDGVVTAEGFRPTELNPRLSAGLLLLASVVDGLRLEIATGAYLDGQIQIDAGWLEDLVVSAADRTRAGGAKIPLSTGLEEPRTVGIEFRDGVAHPNDDLESATLTAGPAPTGAVLRLQLDARVQPAGPSVAPYAVAAARLAARLWRLDIPPLVAAPDIRTHTA